MPAAAGAGPAVGKRVSLRPIRDEDVVALEKWYEEAARTAFEGRGLDELQSNPRAQAATLLVIEKAGVDDPIGLLEYEAIEGWLTVPLIALAKSYRGWGYGSEAVRLLEESAVREGVARRFRADVPVRNGLGLYFWLRLGYRPHPTSTNEGREVMTMARKGREWGQVRSAVSSKSD